MSVLTPVDQFDDVYELATSDPVKGGTISGAVDAPTDGHANAQAQALANRTKYLKERLSPTGEILMWPTSLAPTGYLVCNGATVSRTTYADLFAIVGTAFGEGNGSTTFHLPDFRGQFIRGHNAASGQDPDAASRTAMNTGGNTGDNIGSIQSDAFEAHTHDRDVVSTGIPSGSTVVAERGTDDTPETLQTGSTGGNETRPINACVNFIIRTGL